MNLMKMSTISRNEEIRARYHEARKELSVNEALKFVSDEFVLGTKTINTIVYSKKMQKVEQLSRETHLDNENNRPVIPLKPDNAKLKELLTPIIEYFEFEASEGEIQDIDKFSEMMDRARERWNKIIKSLPDLKKLIGE